MRKHLPPFFPVKAYNHQLLAWNLSYGGPIAIPEFSIKNAVGGKHIGHMFSLLILLLIGAALLGSVANATTGITIAHSRFNNATITFTPNPNITSTAGFVPLIQVVPLVFVGTILGFGLDELAMVL